MNQSKQNRIPRDPKQVPVPGNNPAVELIMDMLDFKEVSKSEAARAMGIPRSRLTNMEKGRKGVSADTAMRFEEFMGYRAQTLLALQSAHDYQKAFHEKNHLIKKEVVPFEIVAN